MGLFTPRYLKDGPGISKDEPQKKPIAHFFELFGRKFTKLILLNLFYCLFWIPTVAAEIAVYSLGLPVWLTFFTTLAGMLLVGPATAGMVKILISFTDEKPVFLISDFMDGFKQNFRQAFGVAALDWCLYFVAATSFNFYSTQTDMGFFAALPIGIELFFMLTLVFANFYMMPMVVKLKLGFRSILKNSVLLAFAELGHNFITLLWAALIVVPCVLFFPITILAILPLAVSLTGFIVCFNSWPIIVKRCVVEEPAPDGNDVQAVVDGQIFDDSAAFLTNPDDRK